jgi:hypothetical protein
MRHLVISFSQTFYYFWYCEMCIFLYLWRCKTRIVLLLKYSSSKLLLQYISVIVVFSLAFVLHGDLDEVIQ